MRSYKRSLVDLSVLVSSFLVSFVSHTRSRCLCALDVLASSRTSCTPLISSPRFMIMDMESATNTCMHLFTLCTLPHRRAHAFVVSFYLRISARRYYFFVSYCDGCDCVIKSWARYPRFDVGCRRMSYSRTCKLLRASRRLRAAMRKL